MEAPDKLYISQLIYGTWQYQTPDPDDETQVEYIRKDALMEWLEKRNKEINGEPKALWRSLEIKELYEKINSL